MLLQNITNYLRNNTYNINISENYIYINNYLNIENISETDITIIVKNNILNIKGNNLKVLKLLDNEILFNGDIENIKIINNT